MRSRFSNSFGKACILAALPVVLLASSFPHASANESALAQLVGVWMPEPVPDEMRTVDGERPPLTEEAAVIYEERIARRRAGDTSLDRTTWCAGPGMPRIMLMPYPFEIISSQDRLAFIHGWYRWFRVVDMAGGEPDYFYPTTMGFPVGHWEGDTLVIRTVGLTDVTTLDAAGLPRSDEMVLTERLRVLPDGRLENRFTIEDPQFYTSAWEARATFRRDANARVGDDVCPDRIARGEPAVEDWR